MLGLLVFVCFLYINLVIQNIKKNSKEQKFCKNFMKFIQILNFCYNNICGCWLVDFLFIIFV